MLVVWLQLLDSLQLKIKYLMLIVQSKKKKKDYSTKSSELEKKIIDHNHDRCITTPEFNKFTAKPFDVRLASENLVTKTDFDTEIIILNKKINSNKTKPLLVENELKKLQAFDSIYFRGKSHSEEDGTHNYLVFQPMYRYFKWVGNGDYIYSWRSKGLIDENITYPATTDYSLTPKLSYFGTKTKAGFSGSSLKQNETTYTHGKIINKYIFYEISRNYNISSCPTLKNCLFGAVRLTKMFVLININILGMVLDLIKKNFFQQAK